MEYGSIGFEAVTAIIKILFMVLGFLMPLASILTWLERRQSAMMQDRLGPKRAFIKLPIVGKIYVWGILHFVADALKFIFKEDYVPSKAHKFLFMWAPIMSMAPALIVAAIIPFGAPLCWGEMRETVGYGTACAQPVPLQIDQPEVRLVTAEQHRGFFPIGRQCEIPVVGGRANCGHFPGTIDPPQLLLPTLANRRLICQDTR